MRSLFKRFTTTSRSSSKPPKLKLLIKSTFDNITVIPGKQYILKKFLNDLSILEQLEPIEGFFDERNGVFYAYVPNKKEHMTRAKNNWRKGVIAIGRQRSRNRLSETTNSITGIKESTSSDSGSNSSNRNKNRRRICVIQKNAMVAKLIPSNSDASCDSVFGVREEIEFGGYFHMQQCKGYV